MSVLTTKQRKAIPDKEYGLPEQRKYPMPDKKHARVAKSYASKEYNEGELSGSEKAKVDAKANKILKKHDPKKLAKALMK